MSDSPQVRTVQAWIAAAKTIDGAGIASLTTDSFTAVGIDENNKTYDFTKAQIFQHLQDQVKPHNNSMEPVRRSLKQTAPDEVVLEGEVILQPAGHHLVYSSTYKFDGDKVDKITLRAKAADFEHLRFHQRA